MNPLTLVELASPLILVAFVAFFWRRERRRPPQTGGPPLTPRGLALDATLLAAAAWITEDTCIRLYDFYQYDAPWRFVADRVPLLVAVIWPVVILSARAVCQALRLTDPQGRPRALAVAMLVIYDAALVEPIAVRAGLWSWNEPGLFDVPYIGILGWGFFAAASSVCLDRLVGGKRVMLLIAAPLATHALLLAAWWGGFRWGLREPLPPEGAIALSVAVASSAVAILFQGRKAGRVVDLDVMLPRMLAAALFFVLIHTEAPGLWPTALYALPFVFPYLMATARPGRASTAAPAV